MLGKLRRVEHAQTILLFTLLFYSKALTYTWSDQDGQAHYIAQREGGEQGDPLMPALYALGQRDALDAAQR